MKNLINILILLTSTLILAQNEANNWYFGRNAGINFNTGIPTSVTNGQLNTFEGCSSISDKNGNLLFYSDGTQVWDKNHNIMPNGTGLLGNSSSSQSALIVPNPTDENIFYLFTVDAQENASSSNGLQYSVINMSLNNGNGEVTSKNNLLVSSATERISAVIGKTCDSFWITTTDTQNFYTFEVTSSGVNTNPIISNLSTTLGNFTSRGYLKFSPDGTKLAFAAAESGSFIYDFDSNTGIISNGRTLNLNDNDGYGVEFSVSGTKLYIATGKFSNSTQAHIYQFDLSNSDINSINNSRGSPIFSYNGSRGALQLGPDEKIYHAVNERPQLGVINNPENDKQNVNYIHNGVNLNGRNSSQGLPPFIQSYFLPTTILNADTNEIISNSKQYFCSNRNYRLKAGRIEPDATYTWIKDGNIIGTDAIITINNSNFGTGIYELTINLKSTCNTTLSANVDIEFVDPPNVEDIPIFIQCDLDNNPTDNQTTFNLTSQEDALTNNANNVIVDFFSESDTSFLNPLPKLNYTNTTNPERLIVRVTSTDTNCFSLGEITLQVTNSGLTNANLSNVFICEIDGNENNSNTNSSLATGKGFYNLSDKTDEIISLNSDISLTSHNIEFYKSFNDAENQNDEITFSENEFANNTSIYVRVNSKSNITCYSIIDFKIFIEPIPIPQGNTNPILLCTNSNTAVTLNAFTGNNSDTYKWYFNNELIPNENDSILNISKEGIYKVEAYRNRNNITCKGFNTFTVSESSKAEIINITTIDDTLNNNSILITITGKGNYEFALNSDNNFIKTSNNFSHLFDNLPIGIYTISIRDRNGCGVTISDEIAIIFFQKHFTPNNDGYFDTWNVLGTNNSFFTSVLITIYDRYGKQIAVIPNKNHLGWNGIYNGKPLPQNDYWYNAILIDKNGKRRIKKSHFSLLRK